MKTTLQHLPLHLRLGTANEIVKWNVYLLCIMYVGEKEGMLCYLFNEYQTTKILLRTGPVGPIW
jgi:hypothetical protein